MRRSICCCLVAAFVCALGPATAGEPQQSAAHADIELLKQRKLVARQAPVVLADAIRRQAALVSLASHLAQRDAPFDQAAVIGVAQAVVILCSDADRSSFLRVQGVCQTEVIDCAPRNCDGELGRCLARAGEDDGAALGCGDKLTACLGNPCRRSDDSIPPP